MSAYGNPLFQLRQSSQKEVELENENKKLTRILGFMSASHFVVSHGEEEILMRQISNFTRIPYQEVKEIIFKAIDFNNKLPAT